MKKFGIILIALIILNFLGLLIWNFFTPETTEDTVPTDTQNTNLPFGSGDDINIPAQQFVEDGDNTDFFDNTGAPTSKLFRLTSMPIAGAVVYESKDETIVRYVDRATGHIYDIILPEEIGEDPVKINKITNTTMPKIYEAYFRDNANNFLVRSINDDVGVVENLLVTLTPPISTSTKLYNMTTEALRGNIGSIAVGTGNNIYYVFKDSSSIDRGVFTSVNTNTIRNLKFVDWKILTAGNNLVLQTKASSRTSGYAYRLNTVSGNLTKILGPLNSLSVLPNISNNRLLYSYTDGGDMKNYVVNNQGEVISTITPATLAEKCVWSLESIDELYCGVPTGEIGLSEPDRWYRGISHYSDYIWTFNTEIQTGNVLFDPSTNNEVSVDVYKPQLSPNEDYLVFINKIDLTLWALRLD